MAWFPVETGHTQQRRRPYKLTTIDNAVLTYGLVPNGNNASAVTMATQRGGAFVRNEYSIHMVTKQLVLIYIEINFHIFKMNSFVPVVYAGPN